MNISRLFILRPIATSLLMAALLLSGLLAYRSLPVAALPQIDYPTIQVQTLYPGASPDVMASVVTAPLERQFGVMPGLTQMSSLSSAGASVITLQFDLSVALDVAEQEVQAAINAADNLLPRDLPNPPIYNKVNPADPPIVTLAATSDAVPLTRLEDLVDTRLAQKISQLPGVGLVTLSGGQRPAVRIQANPKALAAAGLTLADVRSAISSANVNGAKGSFDGPERASTIDANDQLASAAEYAQTIIGYKDGAPLRLQDVAEVVDGAENARLAAYVAVRGPDAATGGADEFRPAIVLSVQRQPGANVISVADSVTRLLPRLQETLPGNVQVRVVTDRTVTIRATVHDVQLELLLSIALVIGVIWLFLRNAEATFIPALAVPLSLVGALGVMYLAGYSLNNLTLMALVIATGFVVDDAIVVIENITRYLESGERPLEAALTGSGQIGFTIISLTISLVAVLIPLLFMGDVAGRLFREFAVTLAVTILISAVISLTLTPMLCAVMLRPGRHGGAKREEPGRFFGRLLAWYERKLDVVLRHQRLTLAVALATMALTVALYVVVPKGFFPVQDTGVIQGIAEAPQDTSFAAMAGRQKELADLLLRDPAVASVVFFVGVDGINQSLATSRLTIALKPLADRDARAPAIARRLMAEAERVPGLSLYLQPVQDLTIEDRISRTQYQFSVEALSREQLDEWLPRMTAALAELPELSHVTSDLRAPGRMAWLDINRDAAARLGISMTDIDNALYDALGQRLVSTIFTQTNQYKVVLEVAPRFRLGPGSLGDIHVRGAGGVAVPLTSVATLSEKPVPLAIARQGQFPVATISFNVAQGSSLGAAVDAVLAEEKRLGLPAALRTEFQGAARAFLSSADNQVWLILAAIVTMYIVLGVLYESYVHPLTILSTLPSAGVGALLALLLADMELGVVGIIGIILLIGIVKKNAIMMIDFALEAERGEGLAPEAAIRQACLLRLRPILMTTLAALLGALPLMIGWGMGAELRRPLGVTMVGGLIVSQALTLFTTPVIYLWFDRLSRGLAARRERGGGAARARKGGSMSGEGKRRRRLGPEFLPWNISAPFIRRPVATTLLTIAVALAGLVSFGLLPVAPLPEVDFPVVVARARMPGAGPETMAATVATPLERALGRIAGVTEMTSTSSLGSSNVVLQFDLDRNIDGAARDVQAAINAARSTLPTMPSNPSYRKVNPAGAPIMILSITSDVLTRAQLYDAASTVLAQKISQIPGVGEVTVGGGALPAVRVEAIPDAVSRLGLSMEDIRRTLAGANAFLPKGMLENGDHSWLVGASDQLGKAEDYRPLIVAQKDGATIRLGDVAKVVDSSQDVRNMAVANGRPAILLIVFRSPGANIIETVDRVKAMLPQLRAWLPESADLTLRMDRSVTIRASLREVEKSLMLAMGLVVLVTFLFLRNVRATAIPAVAAPVSLIATFGVMYLCGYSLDNLSLMALTVSTGFVVDDAIVVLENIVRRLELGESPLRAALHGAREVGFTVISISLSLVAVFAPIVFMGGVVGRLFREFAVVLTAAVLVSMLVSLTTTPMMCAQMLRPFDEQLKRRKARLKALRAGGLGPLARWMTCLGMWWGAGLARLQGAYAVSLDAVLRHPRLTLLGLLLVIAGNVWLYVIIPKGFFPQQDTGVIMGGIRADQSASFQSIQGKLEKLVNVIRADPAVEQVSAHISGARAGGGVFIALKPLPERKVGAEAVIGRLRAQLSAEPGLRIFLRPAQDIMMGGRSSRSQYQYTLQADDLEALRLWGRRLQEALSREPLFRDVDSDIEERGLQTMLDVNRDALARAGLTMGDVDTALNNAFGQRQVSTIYRDKNQYRVVLEYGPDWLEGAEALAKVRLPGKEGLVPLLTVASVGPGFAPLSVAHQGQFAAVTVSFNLAEGASLSQAQAAIAETRVRIGMPADIVGSFQGTAKMYSDTMRNQVVMILAALAALYIVLGVLYESLVHPLTILSTLPSAGGGALLALMACGMEFSVIALIGVLLLAGIVKKNAIMMIDFALEAQRTRRLTPETAIREACALRFRPIMMTTAAAILGAVPLALGQGDGAEIRHPLGVAIVGGLLLSQLLTLYTTPVVYLCLDHARIRARRLWLRLRYGRERGHWLELLGRKA